MTLAFVSRYFRTGEKDTKKPLKLAAFKGSEELDAYASVLRFIFNVRLPR